jgi:nucleoid DNA-binding protein
LKCSLNHEEELLAKAKGLKKAMTKTQVHSDIAESTGLSKKQVGSVLDALESIIERHVRKGSVGSCTVPGLMKIKTVKKPAQKAKKNVPNPFKPGELMDVQAKPASTRIKILPLKNLKDMV